MVIAKPFNITIDSKQVKILRDKSWQTFVGDSVILNVKVIEDGVEKPFDINSIISVLYTNENVTVEQKSDIHDGISIIDPTKGYIEIKPKDNCLSVGTNIITISISDVDENITLQQFIINTYSTMNDSIIVDKKDDIETLSKLATVIDNFPVVNEELAKISKSADDMKTHVEANIVEANKEITDTVEGLNIEVHEALVGANLKVDDELEKMQNKVDNKNNELDTIFTKSVELSKRMVSNKMVFSTEVINKPSRDLIKYSYLVHINTSPYSQSITTQFIGILTFAMETNGVTAYLSTLSNKSVQGNSIQVACQFSNGLGTISNFNEVGYKIVFNTNGIPAALSNSRCMLTPISSGLL